MKNTSFRDPSGFVFLENGVLYRQINNSYKENYDFFVDSGLYEKLVQKNYIVSHKEVVSKKTIDNNLYKLIQPEKINFISYPYEWSFSQLKDAALLTLEIQKLSLKHGMSLKDATNFNVQFKNGKPIFIDTLSFEKYQEGKPWIAYKQFCQHFLAPLCLMCVKDIRMNQLLKNYIDGIPLDLAAKLLPLSSRLNFGVLTHIFLHSDAQKHYETENLNSKATTPNVSKLALEALIDSLESTLKSLKLPTIDTEWGDYYTNTNYSDEAFSYKKEIVSDFLDIIKPSSVLDLGANRGDFSRLASGKGIDTVSCDIDPIAVEKNYNLLKKTNESHILPLLIDLANPTPGIGFMNDERFSFVNRAKFDFAMALALIHHLAISNNLPFDNIAEFFSNLTSSLAIEFVPKEDSKVQILLSSREDIFLNYNEQCFKDSFSKYFDIIEERKVEDSLRTIFLMRKK